MARIIFFLQRHKWWILAVISSIGFSLIFLLIYAVIFLDEGRVMIASPDQFPPTATSPQLVMADTPLPRPKMVVSSPAPTVLQMRESQERQLAFVQRVIDGDSIEVILDGDVYQLRYIGVDAPELGMPLFNDAKEANESLVLKQIVELERDITETDKYGRLLRYVYLPDGTFVNAELVGLGMAKAFTYSPDVKHQHKLINSEQYAQNSGSGIWSTPAEVVRETDLSIGFILQIDPSCSQFNAPGNDNHNKNEEYVCVVNSGPGMVELSGWSIRDEYGWTYRFEDFNLDGNSMVVIYTGCGMNTPQDLFWCKDETAVWNNDGDCAYLLDSEGIEAAKYCY